MREHNTVGFEFEFIGHDYSGLDAHVIFTTSGPLSNLFELGFVLESDANDIVEIGMPPFLIPKIDGKPNKPEIGAVYLKMEAAMRQIKKMALKDKTIHAEIDALNKSIIGLVIEDDASQSSANQAVSAEMDALQLSELEPVPVKKDSIKPGGAEDINLAKLVDLCKECLFAQGWSDIRHGDIGIINAEVKKAGGAAVYSQMNISMDGFESAELIVAARKLFPQRNFCEDSPIGLVYFALQDEGKNGVAYKGTQAQFVHVNKALASTLAIPSILFRQRNGDVISGDDDLSSAVKELASVWVKDALPNILSTLGAFDREELANHAAKAKDLVVNALGPLMERINAKEDDLNGSIETKVKNWMRMNNLCCSTVDKFTYQEILNCARVLGLPPVCVIQETARVASTCLDDAGDYLIGEAAKSCLNDLKQLPDRNSEMTDEAYLSACNAEVAKLYDQQWASLKNEVLEQVKAVEASEARHVFIVDKVNREIDALIERIRDPSIVTFDRPAFTAEQYGDGMGVRKDTFINGQVYPCCGKEGMKGIEYNIVELRSMPAVGKYLGLDRNPDSQAASSSSKPTQSDKAPSSVLKQ
ncbi:hypothetical protein BK671_09695 [Pseudomonas fluorescens]|uniref:Uncharacterized protein n=2 Tax=Pseudomonas fluorescens TaxID=294 RepID=A0A423LN59_PSEFL|nr:hypothetical protein BK671_09695 [Pseudomonas fluorescens]